MKSRLVTICLVAGLLVMAASASANNVASSTIIFEGPLTDAGGGIYTGTVDATAGTHYIPGGPGTVPDGGGGFETPDGRPAVGGFDVYAREGATAYYDDVAQGVINGEHDGYPGPAGGGWGAFWSPDIPDWEHYQLTLTATNWYMEYKGANLGTPMSGALDWAKMYASEDDTGSYRGDLPADPDANDGGAAALDDTSPAWDMDWTWGSELIPLELSGFDVTIDDLGGGDYRVTLTPAAATRNVPADYPTIEAAINAANSGDTINVAAGTYPEGVIQIDKDLSIIGATAPSKPVITPTEDTGLNNELGPNGRGWFQITAAAVDLENLVFNGAGQNIRTAVHYHGDSLGGTVENCEFANVSHISQYYGRGINNYGQTVEILDCSFDNIQRIGVFTYNPTAITLIDGCTFTGKGDGDWLDYAVEAGNGGSITVSNSNISACTGVADVDGSSSAGVLVTDFYGTGTQATFLGNTITGCTNGIHVGYNDTDLTVVTAHYNNLVGNNHNGIYAKAATSVDAEYNWWGDASGPSGVGPGTGDAVSANVDYDPWLGFVPDLIVDPSGNGDYTTLQDAVDNADPGDTIFVISGSHTGAIVDKNVTIIGSSNPAVITSGVPYKDGSGLTTAFRLEDTADGAEIKNFIIECDEPAGFYFAVFSRAADDVTIDSLTISGSVQGITNYGGSNWQITNNTLNSTLSAGGGGIGIMLGTYPPTYTTCSGNLIEGNRIITDIPGAVAFSTPAIAMVLDCRWGRYDILTGAEEMTNNQILNNILMDEDHFNQIGVEAGVIGLEGDPVKIAAVIGVIHDNLIKGNTILDTDAGVYFYNLSTLTIEDNTIQGCADSGVYIEGDQSGCVINNNSISGNANYGVNNNAPTEVNAENNWWGAADGPSGEGAGSGDAVSINVDFDPYLTLDPWTNILQLNVQGDPAYLQPGDIVVIDMDALDLAQHVFGCQAILNFDSTYFLAGAGEVDVQPGGGLWNELIWNQWDTAGDLDVAVGVDLTTMVGTKADGTVAKFTLTADPLAPDGTTEMVFRADVDDIEGTFFADFLAQAVYPGSKIASQTIVIDGTPPADLTLSADPLCTATTTDLTFSATDSPAGIDYYELFVDTVSQGPVTSVHTLDLSGYADGDHDVMIRAYDNAGNSSDSSVVTVTVDKTAPVISNIAADQGGGSVLCGDIIALQGIVDIYVDVVDNGCAALVVPPTVTVAGIAPVTYIGVVGDTYQYEIEVLATTANGSHTITVDAADALGNASSDSSASICVNKNQITGSVELEDFVGSSRAVTFVADAGAKSWSPTLSFAGSVASFTLTDVPDGTADLSAKANWNLRVKLATPAVDGQATADFTGASKLRGGDLNGSNSTNILDYAVLKTNWFTTNAVADITGDGKVNLPDFLLLRTNWFQRGDAQ